MIVASLVVIFVLVGLLFGYQHRVQTAESIEFLESGVILRVTPSVDDRGQIMLEVHPEVSNGTVDANGIPSQTTTEVTTRLLVPNGQTVFLGEHRRYITFGINLVDHLEQSTILLGPLTLRSHSPGVVVAPGDLQHPAHLLHRVPATASLDTLVSNFDSLAK